MMGLLLAISVLVVAVGISFVIAMARLGTISSTILLSLASACCVGLFAMLLSDWPWGVLAEFWRDHSVISAVLSTLLMVGIGFLAFEARDTQEQGRLDETITVAGMGGLVDHFVDVEVALALVGDEASPNTVDWANWRADGRPLRWLRTGRQRLARTPQGSPQTTDPRSRDVGSLHPTAEDHWREELIDQAIRRVIAAMRDWAPVVGRSRNGQRVLVSIGLLRNDLLHIQGQLASADPDDARSSLRECRRTCRVLAYALEHNSGKHDKRPEVLLDLRPLEEWSDVVRKPARLRLWSRREKTDWTSRMSAARVALTSRHADG
jgi:hypothetical protein